MARRELLLDRLLPREQPIHRRVQIVLAGFLHAEVLGQRGGVPPARGGQLWMRGDDARRHHGAHQVALATGARCQQRLQPQPSHGYTHRLHVTLRTRGNGLELLGNGTHWFAAQHRANGQNLRFGERRQIGKGAFAHARTFAIGLAQKVCGARTAIRDALNMHDYILDDIPAKSSQLHGYILTPENPGNLLITQCFYALNEANWQ